jgi:Spy/CpxP family protein refolding chaperone
MTEMKGTDSMSTTRRFALGIGTAVIALGITAALYASSIQNTAGDPPPFIGHRGPMALGAPLGQLRMIASRLGLSDAQKEQIKGVFQAHHDEWTSLAGRALAAHKALEEAVSADTIDDSAIRQRSADVAAVQADIAVAGAHARAEVFQLLTPDQRAQAKSIQSKIEQRFDERRQQLQ